MLLWELLVIDVGQSSDEIFPTFMLKCQLLESWPVKFINWLVVKDVVKI